MSDSPHTVERTREHPGPLVTLVRHGETEWSLDGRHTSVSDIPLTTEGERQAASLKSVLARENFDLVLTSPLQRASHTAELAGMGAHAEVWDLLGEWNYGRYEGITTPEIHLLQPGWSIFEHGAPGGESPSEVGARADEVISRLRRSGATRVVIFAHGHFLRVLGARWIALPASGGIRLVLDTASVSELGYERESTALTRWNDTSHLH